MVDDEPEIRNVLRILFVNLGNEVIEAQDGEAAIRAARETPDIDICIMDIMMPKMSGIAATAEIRKFSDVPILFLTAKSLDDDKFDAYTAGGDDYIVKPFAPRDLVMKATALSRRYNRYSAKELEVDAIGLPCGVILNPSKREVLKNGEPIDIRDKELEVLIYLAQHRGKTVSAAELYESVWQEIPLGSSANTVTVHILNIRRKLGDNSSKIIRTVWGRGYQID
ncbi:MAG: response regulator transcription factor [Clostridia bacterium]|nr:response regulator transcription factor [Clostridia bacterium]